jgi:hypothetical protein
MFRVPRAPCQLQLQPCDTATAANQQSQKMSPMKGISALSAAPGYKKKLSPMKGISALSATPGYLD